ncbi:TPA: hypothetical protein O4B56_001423 [Staphylococcus aureus]|uniref:hypothetical protein n=1 Tax=Staphylococcus aureus TaxID=1280 RepID=UPI001942A897|nr:hypothetical protein [Staphylococcus aureus]MCJ8137585.1 hypothetical protein [Staphylococcus aureus]HCZ8081777.1 hypothetical protein [Staphylococcus aureus]HCZ8299499.1 hypothetical protein [Staphylococcus aureus]HDD7385752.1 hypothetical protein [Staphylococcus aureus]
MKIKVKKEMRLDELIKWARENPELSKGKIFLAKVFSNGFVRFQRNTNTCSISSFIPIDTPFIVDIEKEVTEETKVDRLIELFEIQEGDYNSTLYENTSIKECLYGRCVPTKAFYILNDDLTMTLIWKDGELLV